MYHIIYAESSQIKWNSSSHTKGTPSSVEESGEDDRVNTLAASFPISMLLLGTPINGLYLISHELLTAGMAGKNTSTVCMDVTN